MILAYCSPTECLCLNESFFVDIIELYAAAAQLQWYSRVLRQKGAKTVEPLRAPRATVEWVYGKQPGESAVSAMVLERHWLKFMYIAKEFELYEELVSWKTKASPGKKKDGRFRSSNRRFLSCFYVL